MCKKAYSSTGKSKKAKLILESKSPCDAILEVDLDKISGLEQESRCDLVVWHQNYYWLILIERKGVNTIKAIKQLVNTIGNSKIWAQLSLSLASFPKNMRLLSRKEV